MTDVNCLSTPMIFALLLATLTVNLTLQTPKPKLTH
jgi:hypothetical protein